MRSMMLAKVPASAFGSLQLSDAPLQDPTDAGIVAEAREGRLVPGEGALPLKAFLDALPSDIPVGLARRSWMKLVPFHGIRVS